MWHDKQFVFKLESGSFAQSIIRACQKEGCLCQCSLFDDVTTFSPKSCGGDIESSQGLTAGFPCQGVSRAGKQAGLNDWRTGLVQHIFRIMSEMPLLSFNPNLKIGEMTPEMIPTMENEEVTVDGSEILHHLMWQISH